MVIDYFNFILIYVSVTCAFFTVGVSSGGVTAFSTSSETVSSSVSDLEAGGGV